MAITADRLMALRVVCLLTALLVLPMTASAQLSLDWYTIDGGGHTFSAGGSLSLGGTIGQPDAGVLAGGGYALFGGFWLPESGASSGVPQEPPTENIPLAFGVKAGMPNPFHHVTHLRLDLPEEMPVSVLVFDPSGRKVRRVHEGVMPAGRHTIGWSGDNASGRRLPAGVYLVQVRAGRHESHHRVVLLQ